MTSNAPVYANKFCPDCNQSGTVLYWSAEDYYHCQGCHNEWEPENHE
jgi:hypothetical protein